MARVVGASEAVTAMVAADQFVPRHGDDQGLTSVAAQLSVDHQGDAGSEGDHAEWQREGGVPAEDSGYRQDQGTEDGER